MLLEARDVKKETNLLFDNIARMLCNKKKTNIFNKVYLTYIAVNNSIHECLFLNEMKMS